MTIRWARVLATLFILTFIVSIIFVVSNHDDAMDFVADFLDSDNGTAFVVFSLLIVFLLLFMKFIAYVVGFFRRK